MYTYIMPHGLINDAESSIFGYEHIFGISGSSVYILSYKVRHHGQLKETQVAFIGKLKNLFSY